MDNKARRMNRGSPANSLKAGDMFDVEGIPVILRDKGFFKVTPDGEVPFDGWRVMNSGGEVSAVEFEKIKESYFAMLARAQAAS